MRLFGHPVHMMLVHFPVALWPAHACLHVFASQLPRGVAGIAGFWLLAAGTLIGGIAAICGAFDLVAIPPGERTRLRDAVVHGLVNGSVLCGFVVITATEYGRYPDIAHGRAFLVAETALLLAMFAGNHLGASVILRKTSAVDAPGPATRD